MGRWQLIGGSDFQRATPDKLRGNKLFWWSLGVGQMWHHLTNYFLIFLAIWP